MQPLTSHRFVPHPLVQQSVQCFWTLEADATQPHLAPILPDSNLEVIINCGAPCRLEGKGAPQGDLPRAFLNPLQQRPHYLHVMGRSQFIGIRLRAWAARSLIDLPTHNADCSMIALNGIWQDFAQSLGWLANHRGAQEAIDSLQQFILDIQQPQPAPLPIQAAVQYLQGARRQTDMRVLAAQSNLSLRQFERQFKYWTGVLPKAYARLIRYENARVSLLNDPGRNMVTLAQDLGYTDQAHFIHEFKRFTTYTPGRYAAQMHLHLT